MSIEITEIEELPIGSAVATLGNVYIKVEENLWLTPLSNGTNRAMDNGQAADMGVLVAFDATFQRDHVGEFFDPEFDQI